MSDSYLLLSTKLTYENQLVLNMNLCDIFKTEMVTYVISAKNASFRDVTPCILLGVYRCCLLPGCTTYSCALKMETVLSSETAVNFYRTIRRYMPKYSTLQIFSYSRLQTSLQMYCCKACIELVRKYTFWIKLVKLWALQWKVKHMRKCGSLTDESLIDDVSWNQLMSLIRDEV
jgi:pyoverdine/dityrosine biosynthesis protein Dit1